MRLLLVDNVTSLTDTARRLRRHGHDVVAASSCLEAAAVGGWFDCAIVEPNLSDGDGVQLAQRLLNRRRVDRVVFFSKREDPELRTRCEDVGAFMERTRGIGELAQVLSPRRQRLASGVDAVPARATANSDETHAARSSKR